MSRADEILNIAQEDISKLPDSVTKLASNGIVIINACENLGPGKKLIPTLKLEPNLPIIVVDDDLIFDSEIENRLCARQIGKPGTQAI